MIKLNNSETGMINDASFLLLVWRMNADKKRLSNYTKKNYYIIICDEENLCPDCERKMKIIGSRKRTVKDISGEEYIFSLRRMRCEECHIIHTEIPNCMIPHKQYSKDAIAAAINRQCDYYNIEESTIFRWKKQNIPDLQ